MAIKTRTQQQQLGSLEQPNQKSEQEQQPSNIPATEITVMCDYEQTREQRIKENRERLQKLGIVDLSHQLKSMASSGRATPRTTPSHRKTPLKSPSLGPTLPSRRSSRLQNAPPVTYVEPKVEKSRRNRDIILEEGSRPEFYTEEHEKLLGSTEMHWEMFVDGYKSDGDDKRTRIYDAVNGKTCHQCRQKTLGQRTHCSLCNLVQGQFCGDCLYMRYGEHVVEANQNPNWICPPCRGICNCSLCRHKKGWAPTGTLYQQVSKLGYKSVAHFLIATKRAPPNADNVSDNQQSTKRALPFEGMEGSDEKSTDEKAETNDQSEKYGATVTEPILNPEDTGRPRTRSKEENADAGVEPVRNSAVLEDDVVSNMKSPKGVGRPRKRPNRVDTDASEDSRGNSEMVKDEPVPVKKKPGKVGRPRKRSKTETVGAGQESVIEGGTADKPVSETKSPNNSSPFVDSIASNINSPNTSGSNVDSIARRLRSRDRALISVC